MIKDVNKGIINISYNYQNLPVQIDKQVDTRLEYQYDATGNKLRQTEIYKGLVSKTTDFVGNFVYVNGKPAWNNYDEGRVVYNTNGTFITEAYSKDHLGNVRVTFGFEGALLKVRQVNSYYAFGMNIKELSKNSTNRVHPNEYLYNGKMMQDEQGLNWLDYGARMYDAVLGRWHVSDAFAEQAYSLSPYRYGLNNPISFIDPDGNLESTHTDENGNVIAVYNDGDNGVYKHKGKGEEAKKEVDTKYSKENTSADGEKKGETEYWDEFRDHDNQTGEILDNVAPGAKILFGQHWEPTINKLHNEAKNMNLSEIANNSTDGGKFDVKTKLEYAPNGSATGKMLNGKYATARSAGNYLAGYNGRHGTMLGVGISFTAYMRLAGAVHQGQWKGASTALDVLFGGVSYGNSPWFGEIEYAGRMIQSGWQRKY
jgi:RHS repeat-associated protein